MPSRLLPFEKLNNVRDLGGMPAQDGRKIRAGKLAGCELVSIYKLDELRGVTMTEDGEIRIGSLTSTTFTVIPLYRSIFPCSERP